MAKSLEQELFESKRKIKELTNLISRLEKELDSHLWKDVKKKGLPLRNEEYECTVITLEGFESLGISSGIRLNVRLLFINGIWKNQHFEEVPYYQIIAWKNVSEPFKG